MPPFTATLTYPYWTIETTPPAPAVAPLPQAARGRRTAVRRPGRR